MHILNILNRFLRNRRRNVSYHALNASGTGCAAGCPACIATHWYEAHEKARLAVDGSCGGKEHCQATLFEEARMYFERVYKAEQ